MATKYAVIDIGTVKVKFLIAAIVPDGSLRKDYASTTLTCFGCDMVDDTVTEKNLERTIVELRRCRQVLDEQGVTSCRAVSTHAMRRAKNRESIIKRIYEQTGFEVENLSPEQEAELFFTAALRDFPAGQRYALVDMGGGSMQVIIGDKQHMEQVYLLPTGSATLHEKFTHDSHLETSFNTPADIEHMRDYILEQLAPIPAAARLPIIYGSTNVLDLVKAIGLPHEGHSDSVSHPYKTYAAHLDAFINQVLPLTFAEREARYPFQKGYMWGIDKAFLNISTLSGKLDSPYIVPTNTNVAQGLVYSLAGTSYGLSK